MKRILILSAVAVLLLSAVSVVVYVDNDKNQMNDLLRANVEALTNGEGATKVCYNRIKSAEGQMVRYCPLCEYIEGQPVLLPSKGHC